MRGNGHRETEHPRGDTACPAAAARGEEGQEEEEGEEDDEKEENEDEEGTRRGEAAACPAAEGPAADRGDRDTQHEPGW